jgi:hypothetical protein
MREARRGCESAPARPPRSSAASSVENDTFKLAKSPAVDHGNWRRGLAPCAGAVVRGSDSKQRTGPGGKAAFRAAEDRGVF